MNLENSTFHLHGGLGGSGGGGSTQGTGGNGGTGEGPTVNINSVENLNMNNEDGFTTLHRAVAWEALHDSAEIFDQPKCHPETRTKLLDNLYNWAINPNMRNPIHWLHGPAGAGKSAVMQTLCQRLQEAGRLGGSFFFKRGHRSCGNARVLFATLAYQLASSRDELKGPISQRIKTDPSILHRRMDVQLRNLILDPWKLANSPLPLALLIDGLDECDGHKIQQEILRLIGSATNNQLRILVASRPEPHIRETFKEESLRQVANTTNIEESFNDVRTYLHAEFSRIHREHFAMQSILTPWPAPHILEMLVKKSSGYFIYASTVIKFVEDEYSRPSKQLDIVVQNIIPLDSDSPFATLDQLYMQILSRVPVQYHPTLCDILCMIIHTPGYLRLSSENIDVLLDLDPGTVQLIIRPLHSLLKVSATSIDDVLGVHHASFLDFLMDGTRSSSFYVGSAEHKAKIGPFILNALAYTYDNPQRNLSDPSLYWYLCKNLRYITSLPPSLDLVPRIQLVNPDFVVHWVHTEKNVEDLVGWLQKIHPGPEALIRRWENYCFVLQYEGFQNIVMQNLIQEHDDGTKGLMPSLGTLYALHSQQTDEVQAIVTACYRLFSQSPNLVRIFHASRLITPDLGSFRYTNPNQLFQTHIVLDLSWDDVLECICSLRQLMTYKSLFFHTLFLFLPAFCWELDHLYPRAKVSRELACGFLQLWDQIGRGERPLTLWRMLFTNNWSHRSYSCTWGCYIRACSQPDSELVRKLEKCVPPWDILSQDRQTILEPEEFYNVIQWLKASPTPRHDLIDRWQGYLVESIVQVCLIEQRNAQNWGQNYVPKDYSDDMLEKRWHEHLKREANFHGPPQEKLIQHWERCLKKAREQGYH